ncbi:MAG TPA: transposase [Polyangiaceae bacterium]|jgi:transposase
MTKPAAIDPRQEKGLALAKGKRARIRHIAGAKYLVPSATENSGGYVVDVEAEECSCPDHGERGVRCKHIWALFYFRQEVTTPDGNTVVTEAVQTVRVTYAQNWPAYNAAQCEEKDRVQALLRMLCDGIEEPVVQKMGRPRLPIGDAIYCAAMKVYVGLSSRRASSDLRACKALGFVDHAPNFSSVCRTMERADLTPILTGLVEQSARPLSAIETSFAADSTGFATTTYSRWFDKKYGEEKRCQRWIKLHAMVGTLTNIFTAVRVTESFGTGSGDSPNFPVLVERTAAGGYDMREVSADKAYLSGPNIAAIERAGAAPFVPFKSDSTGKGSPAIERMWHLFSLHREDFLAHYHQRSNVEATFSAVKRKLGASLRSRTLDAQFNETLIKALCFNLSMLVHAIHELGIDPKFWTATPAGSAQ